MASRPVRKVYIALGSNLPSVAGDSAHTLYAARDAIDGAYSIDVTSMSGIYTSEPAYETEQPKFANAVLQAHTTLAPADVLRLLQYIENDFMRDRGEGAIDNGPRTLDLDIIDYEGVVCSEDKLDDVLAKPGKRALVLPHPLALERDFVVSPLLEIAPHMVFADGTRVTRERVKVGKSVLDVAATQVAAASAASQAAITSAARQANGTLYICATPIGNMRDMTLRVIDAFKESDVIYAEDTRVTRKLLSRYDIHTPLKRCDENTIRHMTPQILDEMREGKRIAYATDAGMPGISDPGLYLVSQARQAGLSIDVLPGASAVTTALVASGLEAPGFYFGGFLPRTPPKIERALNAVAGLKDTVLVFYESPHRIHKSMPVIAKCLAGAANVNGNEREVVIARELTKLHEEVIHGSASEVARVIAERTQDGRTVKGEIVLLISAA
ncbi:MAG: 16S rRNA (cytidine(1402)-2'-O)-methyltransferase [Coriobacteriales bacterium]|jgi:16S rRNA (cytidine1402-2'-O)-methyltransferase|nr:16S rRNA (cytidine(1402)-2'-O)-methyltransferase [Coriobacteriales bacterium]